MSAKRILFHEDFQHLIFRLLTPTSVDIPDDVGAYAGTAERPEDSLLDVALTCSAFTDVALLHRWDCIKGLDRLLQVWIVRGVVRIGAQGLEIVRPPTEEDRARFRYYSRKIRLLTGFRAGLSEKNRFHMVNPHFLSRLCGGSVTSKLFPRLQFLIWHSSAPEAITDCSFILRHSPNLAGFKHLCRFPQSSEQNAAHWYPMLHQALFPIAKQLQSLEVDLKSTYTHHLARFNKLVAALSSATQVGFPDEVVDYPDVLRNLSQLPRLQVVYFQQLYEPPKPSSFPGPKDSRPQIASVQSIQGSLIGVAGFASLFRLPALVDIDINTNYANRTEGSYATWSFVWNLFNTVGSNCPLLEFINIDVSPLWPHGEEMLFVTDHNGETSQFPGVFEALTNCKLLVKLKLDINTKWRLSRRDQAPPCFNPTDEDWSQLVDAWPHMTRLIYNCGPKQIQRWTPGFYPTPKATIRSIYTLFKKCKNLVHIDIPINIRRMDTLRIHPSFCILASNNQRIRYISLKRSWIDADCVLPLVTLLQSVIGLEVFLPDWDEDLSDIDALNQAPSFAEHSRKATWLLIGQVLIRPRPGDIRRYQRNSLLENMEAFRAYMSAMGREFAPTE